MKKACRLWVPIASWSFCGKELMQLQPEQEPKIGYVVSTWPRLWQTFVSNGILAE